MKINNFLKIFLFFLIFPFFLGCESVQKGLGIIKDDPDEFLVKKANPLKIPPNYDLIPPGTKKKNTQAINDKDLKTIVDEQTKKIISNSESNNTEKVSQGKSLEDEILNSIKND